MENYFGIKKNSFDYEHLNNSCASSSSGYVSERTREGSRWLCTKSYSDESCSKRLSDSQHDNNPHTPSPCYHRHAGSQESLLCDKCSHSRLKETGTIKRNPFYRQCSVDEHSLINLISDNQQNSSSNDKRRTNSICNANLEKEIPKLINLSLNVEFQKDIVKKKNFRTFVRNDSDSPNSSIDASNISLNKIGRSKTFVEESSSSNIFRNLSLNIKSNFEKSKAQAPSMFRNGSQRSSIKTHEKLTLFNRSKTNSHKTINITRIGKSSVDNAPLMYKRAVSLRGPSGKLKPHVPQQLTVHSLAPDHGYVFHRSFSDRIPSQLNDISKAITNTGLINRVHQRLKNGEFMRGSKRSSNTSLSDIETSSEDCGYMSGRSSSSSYSFDVVDFIKNDTENEFKNLPKNNDEDVPQAINYLISDMRSFSEVLTSLIATKMEMTRKTPERIRQHFDVAFRLIEMMYDFQEIIVTQVESSNFELENVALVFQNNKFSLFKQYLVMVPDIQKQIKNNEEHFKDNFPFFKSNVIRPSLRLVFYSNFLRGLCQIVRSTRELKALQKSCIFLESLKKQANFEMTINAVQESPIDLRLCGKIIHVGELRYVGGPLYKSKLVGIVFENTFVIAVNKHSYIQYQSHFRVDQLEYADEDHEENLILIINDGKKDHTVHTFRCSDPSDRRHYILILKQWMDDNEASYELISDQRDESMNMKTNRMLPLSLQQIFPVLKEPSDSQEPSEFQVTNYTALFHELLVEENNYVQRLEKLLDPETIPPPIELQGILKDLKNFHAGYLLPEIREAFLSNPKKVFDCFFNALYTLSIYQDYIEARCQATLSLTDGVQACLYISPINHLAFYLRWLKKLSIFPRYKSQCELATSLLRKYLNEARVKTLHRAIYNCRIDFFRCGEFKRKDKFEVKCKSKSFKSGDYDVILFGKVILITKPNPPRYELINDLWLDRINLGPPSNGCNGFKLELRQGNSKPPITYEFISEINYVREQWLKHLEQQLNRIAEEIKLKCMQNQCPGVSTHSKSLD